jgi:hypothetical protein
VLLVLVQLQALASPLQLPTRLQWLRQAVQPVVLHLRLSQKVGCMGVLCAAVDAAVARHAAQVFDRTMKGTQPCDHYHVFNQVYAFAPWQAFWPGSWEPTAGGLKANLPYGVSPSFL